MKQFSLMSFACLAALSLSACVGSRYMETRDMSQSPSEVFAADSNQVSTAVKHSIDHLGYSLVDEKKLNNVIQIYFNKHVSAFSWGEVGRVDVEPQANGRTKVTVGSEKRAQMQLFGTTEDEFAKEIFASVRAEIQK